jgi:uracil-DNA glycosylase
MIRDLIESDLSDSWKLALQAHLESDSFVRLDSFLRQELVGPKTVFPMPRHIFSAFRTTDLDRVKVVLLGQDPYHRPGQAIGLSFGVPNELAKKPPSLKNLFRELGSDLGKPIPKGPSDLTGWAHQGVLLLNTCLTVREGEPLSHVGRGWEEFTTSVIESLVKRKNGIVFLLLGAHAQSFRKSVNSPPHRIIEAPHPSPLSAYRGFFGSRIFSRTNEALMEFGHSPIDWERISLK